MSQKESPNNHPEYSNSKIKNIFSGARRHWKSLTLSLAALGGLTYGTILMARPNVDDIQSKEPIKASDPYKAPETGVGLVPVVTPEAVPTIVPSSPTPDTQGASGSSPDPGQDDQPEPKDDEPDPTKVVPDTKPTKAPATATPETENTEPCLIVPEKYCDQGVVIRTEDRLGHPETYIGFDFPENVSISTDRYGQTLKGEIGQPNAFKGSVLLMVDPNLKNVTARSLEVKGDIGFEDMISRNVPEGTEVASVKNKGIKNFGKNVLISVRYFDPKLGYGVPDEDYLRKKFPKAFSKPAQYFKYSGPEQPGNTVLSPLFAK